MFKTTITGQELKDMMFSAAGHLEKNKAGLDALNVFPVPDGDTGTNMSLTMMSAAKELQDCDAASVAAVASAVSMGALKGARGNSGVILSQLFRGFAKGLEGTDGEINAADFARAMDMGVKAAYKAVMKPKEGTILTVAREMAAEALRLSQGGAGILELMDAVLDYGEETLKKTPEMLPVLKEAGVVDAGGKGLLIIYHAFKMSLEGVEVEIDFDNIAPNKAALGGEDVNVDIEFGYCTEFFIKHINDNVTEQDIERLRDKLMGLGDCVLVVGDVNLLKVHVHTNMPGKALQLALRYGELSGVKIDNMREQHTELLSPDDAKLKREKKPLAIVAVAAGEGIKAIFKDLSVDHIVEGGQTMNPSTDDIAKAIDAVNADNVIILPNNKNIILAAEQAAFLVESKVFVVKSKSIPQGVAATLAFNPDLSAKENYERMESAVTTVKTGQITKAVRPSKVNGFEIKDGDMLGMYDGDITVVGAGPEETGERLLKEMVSENDCVITVFFGEDIRENAAREFGGKLSGLFSHCDIEVQYGGQPVYDYIFSVE